MAAKVAPPPERFGVTRTGEPDRLAPPIAVPVEVPEHAPAPVTPERTAAPAGWQPVSRSEPVGAVCPAGDGAEPWLLNA